MFGQNKETGITYISAESELQGEMSFIGDVIIHGSITGKVHCDGNVTLGKTGKFTGELTAKNVVVAGKMDGQFECVELNVENHGEVSGTLYCEKIKIIEGGQFFGERKTPKTAKTAQVSKVPQTTQTTQTAQTTQTTQTTQSTQTAQSSKTPNNSEPAVLHAKVNQPRGENRVEKPQKKMKAS